MSSSHAELLRRSRDAFLSSATNRARGSLREVDFAAILDELVEWSAARGDRLYVREPGDQHTVSFGLSTAGYVLWSAYPRNGDGAKVVVLPKLFRRTSRAEQIHLVERLRATAPAVKLEGTSLLQLPMHLLASDRAMAGFLELLDVAHEVARRYAGERP